MSLHFQMVYKHIYSFLSLVCDYTFILITCFSPLTIQSFLDCLAHFKLLKFKCDGHELNLHEFHLSKCIVQLHVLYVVYLEAPGAGIAHLSFMHYN